MGNVNKQMHRVQDGVKNWRRALTGETGRAAEAALMAYGRTIAKPRKPRRKLWRVSA